jgi:hypothetical protein
MKILFYKISKVILLSFISLNCLAQKHDNIWLYGKKSSSPIVKITKMTFTNEDIVFEPTELDGSFNHLASSMCDSSGNLLYYSNGCNIRNKNGFIMENGDSINWPFTDTWISICDLGGLYGTSQHFEYTFPQQ